MATPIRTIRVPDELWDKAQGVAKAEGTTISIVIRSLLEAWIITNPPR